MRPAPHSATVNKAAEQAKATGYPYALASADRSTCAVMVLIGPDAWDVSRAVTGKVLHLVCPPGEDPHTLKWRALRDRDPIIIKRCGDVAGDSILALCQAMFRDGVTCATDIATGAWYRVKR